MLEKALARLDLWTHNYSKLIRNSLKNVCSTHLAFKLSAPGLLRATKASSIKSFVGKRRFSISRSLSQAGAHGILSFTISFHTIARLHEIEETLDYATEICFTWLEGKQWFRGLRLASFFVTRIDDGATPARRWHVTDVSLCKNRKIMSLLSVDELSDVYSDWGMLRSADSLVQIYVTLSQSQRNCSYFHTSSSLILTRRRQWIRFLMHHAP